jgi:hemoglobin
MSPYNPYELLGGDNGVRTLVDRFYDLMDTLPEAAGIRALHPQDLQGSRDKLYMFLSGWLGGPPLYVERHGHPMLRARHLPFAIGDAERDAWMLCMRKALEERHLDPMLHNQLLASLQRTADHMRNRDTDHLRLRGETER